MSEYRNPDALVSTDWLAKSLADPSILVIEVDEDTAAYEKGHIPGAISWDWNRDLHDGLRRDYIDRDRLGALLARSGVTDETTVILYSGNSNWFAAYAYWVLRYRGFDAVKLLNGGRKKWELEERPLVTEVPEVRTTDFSIRGEERPELRAMRDDVIGKVGSSATFIDVRSPQEFSGEVLAPPHLPQEQPYVGGHIPGAKNVPWSKAANEDGTFRSADELKALYEEAGVSGEGEIITYCRIGERAAHSWFLLTELLGYDRVLNYDGSWTEYGSLVGVPVERGDGTSDE